MKYMGSKNRIAKHILPIILKDRKEGQWYVEPFVGGANMIDKVDGNRIGNDSNYYLIQALRIIQEMPEILPDLITEDDYQIAKNSDTCEFSIGIRGYIGFSMSFGGKWFGGYRRDVAGTKGCIENMKTQSRRSKENALKQSKKIQGVIFSCMNYIDMLMPLDSIIYCDPPYQKTTKYDAVSKDFNHEIFWEWCRIMSEYHQVFISEYNAPDDFECIWQKEISNTLEKEGVNKKPIEKLFIYKK